jgi:hypothetical protein
MLNKDIVVLDRRKKKYFFTKGRFLVKRKCYAPKKRPRMGGEIKGNPG